MKIIVLLILSYTLFIHGLASTALWDPDEPRQAIMAREMMERGDYIHPYLNGKPYLEKPPLYSWAVAAAARATGRLDEFSSRIPAALSATLLLLATWYLGGLIADRYGGFLSALVLATNYQFLSNARESVMDMTFAFFIGLAILLCYRAAIRGKRGAFVFALIPGALAILTKGPAGLVIPVAVMGIYLLVTKRLKGFLLPLLGGTLLAMALAAIWFLLAGEEYAREFILRQNITRYTRAFDHIEDLTYYFHKLFFNFLPWSILLPFALYHGFRKGYRLPLIWFLFTFLFFEFSKSKRAIYLLSCYPACALLCGLYLRDAWARLLKTGVTRGLITVFSGLLLLLPLAAAAALHMVRAPVVDFFREAPVPLYLACAILVVVALVLVLYVRKGKEKGSLALLFLYIAVLGVTFNLYYMPVMDRNFKSPKLVTGLLADVDKDTAIYTYGFNSPGFIFYAGRPIRTINDIKEMKEGGGKQILIVEDRPAAAIRGELEKAFTPLKKSRYEKEHYTIYVRKHG